MLRELSGGVQGLGFRVGGDREGGGCRQLERVVREQREQEEEEERQRRLLAPHAADTANDPPGPPHPSPDPEGGEEDSRGGAGGREMRVAPAAGLEEHVAQNKAVALPGPTPTPPLPSVGSLRQQHGKPQPSELAKSIARWFGPGGVEGGVA